MKTEMKTLDDIIVVDPMWDGYNGKRYTLTLGELKERIKWNKYLNSVETYNGKYGWADRQTGEFWDRDYGWIFQHPYSFPTKKVAEEALEKFTSLLKAGVYKYLNFDVYVRKFPDNMLRPRRWTKNYEYDYSFDE